MCNERSSLDQFAAYFVIWLNANWYKSFSTNIIDLRINILNGVKTYFLQKIDPIVNRHVILSYIFIIFRKSVSYIKLDVARPIAVLVLL
jgi:hypothetical protein